MHRRQGRRQVGVAFVGDEHDGARLGDGHVRARDADRRVDELLAQRRARVALDRLDGRLCAENFGGILFGEVNRRREYVRRSRLGELLHPLSEVGPDNLHPYVFEVRVELDLLGSHRLDLGPDQAGAGRQSAARVPAQLADDFARLCGVLGQMDNTAHGGKSLRELFQQFRKAVQVGDTALLQVGPTFLEVEGLERLVAAATQAGHRADQRFLQAWIVERSVYPAREVTTTFFQEYALRAPGALVVEASLRASATAVGVVTGAKHMVPAHTTARRSPSGSTATYGCAARPARASSRFLVVTLIACGRRSSARAKTAAIRPYCRGRAATASRARRACSRNGAAGSPRRMSSSINAIAAMEFSARGLIRSPRRPSSSPPARSK